MSCWFPQVWAVAWVLAMFKGPWVSLMCSLWEEDTPWVFRGQGEQKHLQSLNLIQSGTLL